MNLTFSFRQLLAMGALASFIIIGSAYGLEYFLQLEPCPLCLIQRYVLWCIGFLCGIGALQNCKNIGRLFYCAGIFLFSFLGIALASRQLWLQYFSPAEVANCIAGFDQLFAFKSIPEIIREIFTASPECSKIDFTILHISLTGWSLLFFIGFALYSLILGWRQIKRRI